MRKRISSAGVTVQAVAGNHAVFLGFDLDAAGRDGCLGFSIHRSDETEAEEYWLSGFKTFKSVVPHPVADTIYSTRDHPMQTFYWAITAPSLVISRPTASSRATARRIWLTSRASRSRSRLRRAIPQRGHMASISTVVSPPARPTRTSSGCLRTSSLRHEGRGADVAVTRPDRGAD